ncbi:DUF6078 family protein [uncultured Bacteroides sp.]|uniref:DUF6078 family protein n=1 Tax=uncultured Bacteroides sp. TaxID=162156 RepID=UPI002AA90F51|nr:DUF6078 family protein [uncultured Bacteroides sp.]
MLQQPILQGKQLHAAHLTALHATPDVPYITIVNPTRFSADAKTCPYFQLFKKIGVAWGVSRLLDNLPYKDACNLKKQLLGHFGKSLYNASIVKNATLSL